jgi:hypothetical protein
MNIDKLKYATLIVDYEDRPLALPMWTIVSIHAETEGCTIETSDGTNSDSWYADTSFDIVMERYFNLMRSA